MESCQHELVEERGFNDLPVDVRAALEEWNDRRTISLEDYVAAYHAVHANQ